MQSKVELRQFVNLNDAENFMNSFGENVVKRELIPLYVPDGISKIVYFVFLELVKD
jgi:hypothetical protein